MTEIPVNRPTFDLTDVNIKQHIETLQGNKTDKVIELSAAPTATSPLLNAGQDGIYNNKLYCRMGNTIYVFDSDSQITVT